LVLSASKSHPFEPADEIDIKFLSYKCCFLLALLSGRRSEMHAFSTSDSHLSFSRNKSSVTLLTDPAFLAKDQIPGRGSEPTVIPALRHDSSKLHPLNQKMQEEKQLFVPNLKVPRNTDSGLVTRGEPPTMGK
jgi:hypothetical protein